MQSVKSWSKCKWLYEQGGLRSAGCLPAQRSIICMSYPVLWPSKVVYFSLKRTNASWEDDIEWNWPTVWIWSENQTGWENKSSGNQIIIFSVGAGEFRFQSDSSPPGMFRTPWAEEEGEGWATASAASERDAKRALFSVSLTSGGEREQIREDQRRLPRSSRDRGHLPQLWRWILPAAYQCPGTTSHIKQLTFPISSTLLSASHRSENPKLTNSSWRSSH